MKMLNGLETEDAQSNRAVLFEAINIRLRTLIRSHPSSRMRCGWELGFSAKHGDLLDALWPAVDEGALKQDEIEVVVQVNGKLRSRIKIPATANKDVARAIALADETVKKFTGDQAAAKVIYVPGKLVNLVVWRTRLVTSLMVLTLALSACGFRLQGREPLPELLWNAQVIAQDPQTDFVQGLRRALIASGGKLTDNTETATGTVRIRADVVTRKILSVSATNTPREYEITYTVEFSVDNKAGEVLPSQKVEITRNFSLTRLSCWRRETKKPSCAKAGP